MSKKGDKGRGGSIVIKREEVVEGGHHGGAWKVAYADFVTAMMAFFLLMWLLNATTEAQRRGIADYFAPIGSMSQAMSGSGLPFGGRTPFDNGSLVSDRGAQTVKPGKSSAMVAPDDANADTSDQQVAPRLVEEDGDPATAQLARSNADGAGDDGGPPARPGASAASPSGAPSETTGPGAPTDAGVRANERTAAADADRKIKAQREKRETEAFQAAADQIRDAIHDDPSLAPFARQIAIDMTPEGLRVQLLDEEKLPMFASGSATVSDRARLLMQKIAPVLAKLSEPIAVTGHTDAQPYHGGDRSNWELSAERANATRRLLSESGLQDSRFRSVTGVADRDLLLPGDPLAAANRRIAIVVLKSAKSADPPTAKAPPADAGPVGPAPATIEHAAAGPVAAPSGVDRTAAARAAQPLVTSGAVEPIAPAGTIAAPRVQPPGVTVGRVPAAVQNVRTP